MRFLLRVAAEGDGFENWSGDVLVYLTPDNIKYALARKELFGMVKSRADDIDEVSYWSPMQLFWSDCFDKKAFLREDERKEYERNSIVRFPDERALDGAVLNDTTGDCETVVFDDRGLRFSCYVNDGSTRVYSEYLPYDQLLEHAPHRG